MLKRCGPHPLQGANPGSLVYNPVGSPPKTATRRSTCTSVPGQTRLSPIARGSDATRAQPRARCGRSRATSTLRPPSPTLASTTPCRDCAHPGAHLRWSERARAPAARSSAPPCETRASTRVHPPLQPGAPLASSQPQSPAQLQSQPFVLPPRAQTDARRRHSEAGAGSGAEPPLEFGLDGERRGGVESSEVQRCGGGGSAPGAAPRCSARTFHLFGSGVLSRALHQSQRTWRRG